MRIYEHPWGFSGCCRGCAALLAVVLLLAGVPGLAQDDRLTAASPEDRLTVSSPDPDERLDATSPDDRLAVGSGAADTSDATASPATPAAGPGAGATGNTSAADNTNGASSAEAVPAGEPPADEIFSSQTENGEPGIDGLQRVHNFPPEAFGETPPGVPYSNVIAKTGIDLNDINSLTQTPYLQGQAVAPTKIGNVDGSSSFQLPNVGTAIPFFRSGTEPDNANIKAGPLYIKFHWIDGLVLYDDNYRRTDTDRKRELLVLLRLNLTIIAQLAENLQFAVSGSLAYLPLQNQVGIQTSAYSSLGLLLFGAPAFASQLVYDTDIGGWPVRFADDFRVSSGTYSDSARDTFNLFQGDYLTQNPDGSYFFRSSKVNPSGNPTTGDPQDYDADVVYASNTLSAVTDRLLPGDVRLTVGAFHENLWYNQSNRGLPPGRDEVYVDLISERGNLRFKPYLSYNASYIEGSPDLTQVLRAGFFGPIDDQLFLRAGAGYYFNANGHTGELYTLSLDHTAGPYTTEHFVLERGLTTFNDQVTTSEYYRLDQVLGPTLDASLFVANFTTQDLISGDGTGYKGEIAGGLLEWTIGPKTSLSLAAIAERESYDRGPRTDYLTTRVILSREVTDSLSFQLLYQYQRASSNNSSFSYYENLVYFRIRKSLE